MSIYRLTLNQLFTNRIFQNVVHMEERAGAMSAAAIADEMRLNWIAAIRVWQAHELLYESITIQQIGVAPLPAPQIVQYVNVDGDGTSDVEHASICAVFSFRTALAGRRNRGRYYVATVPAAHITNDVLNPDFGIPRYAAMATSIQNRYSETGNGPLKLLVWHRDLNNGTPVTQVISQPRLGILRKRNVGIGI